jgi:mRNA-degrading endonuclease RelE of RelBE toxin-antitoxin system
VEVFYSGHFKKSAKRLAKRYKSLKKDLQRFVKSLEADPAQGARLAEGLYKVRVKNSDNNRGKSAGYRIITYAIVEDQILLVDIYAKSDMANISDEAIDLIVREYMAEED